MSTSLASLCMQMTTTMSLSEEGRKEKAGEGRYADFTGPKSSSPIGSVLPQQSSKHAGLVKFLGYPVLKISVLFSV